MKHFIFLTFFFAGLSVQAAGTTLLKYEYGVRYGDDRRTFSKIEISVDDGGVAEITRYDFINRTSNPTLSAQETKRLAPSTVRSIKTMVATLASAKVVTIHRRITCKLMPHPSQRYGNLFVRSAQSSELRLVSGPQGCWIYNVVGPETEVAKTNALKLKERLRVLGDEALGL